MTSILWLPAPLARAQDSQFMFDPNGNLLTQTAALIAPPQILAQPQMQVVVPGELASFFVVAVDPRGLSYQWLFNGTNLPGATADTLLITNVSSLNQGSYAVVLTNVSGSITSSVAQLYIDSRGVGMPDSWQLMYFGNLNQNPAADFDHDGVSNLQEFLDGTNPTNSASARFRLAIVSAGAFVNEAPTRLSYTNGEVVTLTATGFAPYTFRAWSGDVAGTNNPVSLTMTNNKTVVAYAGPFNITWTNPVSGDWNAAANWFPNLAPGMNDNVFITNAVTVTLTNSVECASLTLNGLGSQPTLAVTGNLTLDGPSYWFAGTMSGSGSTIIQPGATLTINNPSTVYLNSRTLDNAGTMVWSSTGGMQLSAANITNEPGALFLAQNSASVSGSNSRFDNAGTFRKANNAGTTTVSLLFNNFGTVDIESGTLLCNNNTFNNNSLVMLAPGTTNLLGGGGSATGSFTNPPTALVEWTGNAFTPPFTLSPGAQLNGSGWYQINGATVNINTDMVVQNLDLPGATINGTGNLTISNVINWIGASINGNGANSLIIAPGAVLNFLNPSTAFLASRTLDNAGTVIWSGVGGMQLTGGIITNRPGALFQVQNAATLSGSSARFDNAGTFRRAVNTGTFTVAGLPFNNYGRVELRSGFFAVNSGYVSSPNALLNCALGGTTAGTTYGQVQISGAVTLNGALSVVLANAFVPATNDTFAVLTAGSRSGTFSSFSYPSDVVTMQLSNAPNSVILRVTGVLPPRPIMLPPQISGANLLLSWTAVSNTTYRVEFNPDLAPSNWNALPGDITSLSNTASKLDALTPTNRFYRVRVIP